MAQATLGHAYALSGLLGEALPLLETAVDAMSDRMHLVWALAIVYLGEGYLAAGRAGEARAMADRALSLTRERKELGNQGWALRLLGEIAARAAPVDVDGAEASYRAAIALAAQLGMAPLRARCHLGLGQCYRRAGRRAEARAELAAAAELFRSLEMSY